MQLSHLATSEGRWVVLDLTAVATLAQKIGLDIQDQGSKLQIQTLVATIVEVLGPIATGLALDPEVGLAFYQDQRTVNTPLILPLTKDIPDLLPTAVPVLFADWGVESVRNNYATAFVSLNYHPAETEALRKKTLLAELSDYCHQEQVGLITKIVIYTPADQEFVVSEFQEQQLWALQEMRSMADMFVVQYPQESLAAATLTAELDAPWLLAGDNLTYDEFKPALRDALENGAKGVFLGDALWSEWFRMRRADMAPDLAEMQQFLKTTVRDRFIEVNRIVQESVTIDE